MLYTINKVYSQALFRNYIIKLLKNPSFQPQNPFCGDINKKNGHRPLLIVIFASVAPARPPHSLRVVRIVNYTQTAHGQGRRFPAEIF